MFPPGKHVGTHPWHGFPCGVGGSSPGKLQHSKTLTAPWERWGENFPCSAVQGWDGRGPTTALQPSWAVAVLEKMKSHIVFWSCFLNAAPSWGPFGGHHATSPRPRAAAGGGRCHHPLNMALLQKPPPKGRGGASPARSPMGCGEEMPLTDRRLFFPEKQSRAVVGEQSHYRGG